MLAVWLTVLHALALHVSEQMCIMHDVHVNAQICSMHEYAC